MAIEIQKGIDPKKYFPDSKYIIEYAFSLEDKHYFKFLDPFNIPAKRALTTITFYREVELNVDRAYLKAHAEAVINCLTSTPEKPQYEHGEALALERMLLNRMNMPKDADLMYKLASVVYFDQAEQPAQYEYEYAKKKIAYWKGETTLDDFFLQMPLRELIPYLEYAGQNLEAYSKATEELNRIHNSRIRQNLSSEQLTTLNASSA